MATIIYEYFRIQNKYFQIPLTPTINTRVECDNCGFVTFNNDYPSIYGIGNEWDNSTISICGWNGGKLLRRFGNHYTNWNASNTPTLTLGQKYNMSLDKNKLIVNGTEYNVNATTFTANNKPLTIGARNDTNSSGVVYMMDGYVGNFRIYDDNVLVMELKPAVNNGQHCYYDTVGDAYYYAQGTGTIEAVNPLHTFTASKSKLSFQSIQSSQNITVTAETGWTATTNNSWISLSQNTGSSGETNITVTVADGSNDGSRVGKITFTDAEDYTFDVDVYQLKLGMKVYVNKYKVGSTNIVKQQRGDDNVKKMYMGNDLVYQKFAFSPKLSISVDSMEFKYSGDTAQTVTVNSNTNWNYTTDVNWLTLTKDGNTLSVLPDDYTSELENRTATITITSDNGDIVKTKTISVIQKKVSTWEPVDYVYTSSEAYVDTTIRPTTNTKFTVKLKQTGRNGGGTVGYFMSNTPITCENDSTDYRCFNYDRTNGFVWDFNGSRISGNISPESDGLIIATFGNNYIADKNGTKVATGSTQSSIATQNNVPIYINLDNRYAQIQQVTIYDDNDVVVFDGHAADVDGEYGVYDTVSETLLKPTNGATVYKGTW